MSTFVLDLYWLDAAIWLIVVVSYFFRIRNAKTNGIRLLNRLFAGIAVVLVVNVLWFALRFSASLGMISHEVSTFLASDGMRFFYNVLMIGSGGVILYYLIFRYKHLDRELAEAGLYARYRYMIEADVRAILLFQVDGKLVEINRVGREWMNGSEADVRGRSILEVLARLQPERPEEMLERIVNRETIEFRVGERILSDFEYSELFDEHGQSAGHVLCVRDVTEDKKFQREIIQSEKLAVVGQLAAATAHEIRNPLTSIKGFLQLLNQRLKGNPHESEIKDYIQIMVEEVDRMEKIIRDFLLMTKPSDVTQERADLNAVIERMLVLVQNQATLRNINVVTEFVPLPEVLMHKEAIQQVVLNLLQNSFEAMNIGGTLTLKTCEDVKYVSVIVNDTGIGMTDEEVSNLGSPFYSTKTEGTGLGLTVSSKIIREHGGKLEVVSEKGVGTTITIKLPK